MFLFVIWFITNVVAGIFWWEDHLQIAIFSSLLVASIYLVNIILIPMIILDEKDFGWIKRLIKKYKMTRVVYSFLFYEEWKVIYVPILGYVVAMFCMFFYLDSFEGDSFFLSFRFYWILVLFVYCFIFQIIIPKLKSNYGSLRLLRANFYFITVYILPFFSEITHFIFLIFLIIFAWALDAKTCNYYEREVKEDQKKWEEKNGKKQEPNLKEEAS
jgi:hypothetical protein